MKCIKVLLFFFFICSLIKWNWIKATRKCCIFLWCCDLGLNELGDSYQFLSVFLLISLLQLHRWPSLHLSPSLFASTSHLVTIFHSFAPVRTYVLRMLVCECECDLRKRFASTFMFVVSIMVTILATSVLRREDFKDLYMIFTTITSLQIKSLPEHLKRELKSFCLEL